VTAKCLRTRRAGSDGAVGRTIVLCRLPRPRPTQASQTTQGDGLLHQCITGSTCIGEIRRLNAILRCIRNAEQKHSLSVGPQAWLTVSLNFVSHLYLLYGRS
jgi:hypothetical protein